MNKIFGQDPHIARVQRSYAEAEISRFADGADNLVETAAAVELARSRGYEKASYLEVRMLKVARARAIGTILEQATLTPGQKLFLDEVLELFDQIPSKDGITRLEEGDKSEEKPQVRISEHALSYPDIGYGGYMLTVEGLTRDDELGVTGRPTLILSDTVTNNRERQVGVTFSEGTLTLNTLTGIVMASTLGSGSDHGFNRAYSLPEFTRPEVVNDYTELLVAATQEAQAA